MILFSEYNDSSMPLASKGHKLITWGEVASSVGQFIYISSCNCTWFAFLLNFFVQAHPEVPLCTSTLLPVCFTKGIQKESGMVVKSGLSTGHKHVHM